MEADVWANVGDGWTSSSAPGELIFQYPQPGWVERAVLNDDSIIVAVAPGIKLADLAIEVTPGAVAVKCEGQADVVVMRGFGVERVLASRAGVVAKWSERRRSLAVVQRTDPDFDAASGPLQHQAMVNFEQGQPQTTASTPRRFLEDLWSGQVRPFLNNKVEVAKVLAAGRRVRRMYSDLVVESRCFEAQELSLQPELREWAVHCVNGDRDMTSCHGLRRGLIVKPADGSLCQGISLVLRTSGQESNSAMLVPMECKALTGPTPCRDRSVVGTLDHLLREAVASALRVNRGTTTSQMVLLSQRVEYFPPDADTHLQEQPATVPELKIIFHRGLPLYASLPHLSDPDMIVWRRDFAENSGSIREELWEETGCMSNLKLLQSVEAIHEKVWNKLGLIGDDSRTQKAREEFHRLVQKLCGTEKGSGSALGLLAALLADWNEIREDKIRLMQDPGEAASLLLRGRMDFLLERSQGGTITACLGEVQTFSGDLHRSVRKELRSFLLKG